MDIRHTWDDLPPDFPQGKSVAIDTETMGLVTGRDRLCLVQLSWGDGVCYLVQIRQDKCGEAHRLIALLKDTSVEKIFHFARFDVAALYHHFRVICAPIYCTKIASRLVRTYTDRHGLKDLCRELLGTEISKTEQTSDWGRETLTEEQKKYAASDVLHLHGLRKKLDGMLMRERRLDFAKACFSFLPHRAVLDCHGFNDDVLQH